MKEKDYSDIINLPHYELKNHPRMPVYMRAAQFSPFAALTGYDSAIKETGRLTDKKIILAPYEKSIIDSRLHIIIDKHIFNTPMEITYFEADTLKDGGKYLTVKDCIKKVDTQTKEIILKNGQCICIEDIFKLECDIFSVYENAVY